MPRIPKDNKGSYFCKGQRISNEKLRANWDKVFGERDISTCPACKSRQGTDRTWRYVIETGGWLHTCP